MSEILERQIVCATKIENTDYWGICVVNDKVSLSEIRRLLSFVNADDRTVEETKKEIENTLLAGKSYKICFDKWKSMRLRVSERFKAVPQKQRQRVC